MENSSLVNENHHIMNMNFINYKHDPLNMTEKDTEGLLLVYNRLLHKSDENMQSGIKVIKSIAFISLTSIISIIMTYELKTEYLNYILMVLFLLFLLVAYFSIGHMMITLSTHLELIHLEAMIGFKKRFYKELYDDLNSGKNPSLIWYSKRIGQQWSNEIFMKCFYITLMIGVALSLIGAALLISIFDYHSLFQLLLSFGIIIPIFFFGISHLLSLMQSTFAPRQIQLISEYINRPNQKINNSE